jgi:hypothetical protein
MKLHNRDWEAMPKMCEFTVSAGGGKISVNPILVRALRPGPTYTTIIFDEKHSISVDNTFEDVQRRLNLAMNEDGTR